LRTFEGDLARFRARLERREPFAFCRFGNGELDILQESPAGRQRYIVGREYRFHPDDPGHAAGRARLLEAFRFRGPSYYVGISCPLCIGREEFEWMRRTSGQDEEHLTWSTLFYYSNYLRFLETVVPLFAGYEVVMVCNHSARLDRLPFPVRHSVRVGQDAWREHERWAGELLGIAADCGRDTLFLLCAGPLGKILTHQLHAARPDLTCLDAGSALDPFLFEGDQGLSRKHLRIRDLQETSCAWDEPSATGAAGYHPVLVVRALGETQPPDGGQAVAGEEGLERLGAEEEGSVPFEEVAPEAAFERNLEEHPPLRLEKA
jgi:hypothetical protein